ncbi:hypothetical protein [Flagellimonas onchidii]|uniref:hypothetical protein n=1 Tax=Flagellimonas onchidii TaxID=2562684 RepID=UPI0010A6AC3A|nr:hypothetical protein [Allomuricauda onchidii]
MATERTDILLDEDFDLKIENGDFVIAPSDQQHVRAIFNAHMGEYKEWPLTGFGASRYLKKSTVSKAVFSRNLKVQLSYDSYTDAEINIDQGIEKLIIEI